MDHSMHTAGGPAPAPVDTTGRHGMLLFGGPRLYLSHLPMFHHPHNFQVLLAVRPDDAARAALEADARLGAPDLYTFDPELFPLAELDPTGGNTRAALRGTVFRGHFERGGRPIAKRLTLAVSEVVYFHEFRLDAEPDAPGTLTYLCFGDPGRLFLAHKVIGRPSFDSVLEVSVVPGSVTNMAGSAVDGDPDVGIGFPTAQHVQIRRDDGSDFPLEDGDTVTGVFAATGHLGLHGFRARLQVGRRIYHEVKELR